MERAERHGTVMTAGGFAASVLICMVLMLAGPGTVMTAAAGETEESEDAFVGGEAAEITDHMTPVTGHVRFPYFLVDFPDDPFAEGVLKTEEVENLLFGHDDRGGRSFSTFIHDASYGQLAADGDVFRYTAKNQEKSYQSADKSFEKLAEEVLSAFDERIDYSDYDSDGDGLIDCFVLNIAGSDLYWYGCQTVWYGDKDFELDGVQPGSYIIDDAQPLPDAGSREYAVQELCHEFGHSLGLPDYYLPEDEEIAAGKETETESGVEVSADTEAEYPDTGTGAADGDDTGTEDFDAMAGVAGTEMMDEMTGDYSSFSRLMLGWLKNSQVHIYSGGTEEFEIPSAQTEGGCILIPRDKDADDIYSSEYMLIEYNTAENNMADTITSYESGVRVMHIQAETYRSADGIWDFRYGQYSPYFSKDGIRILRLVGPDAGYRREGDVLDRGTDDFAWYDEAGHLTIDTGVRIEIRQIRHGTAKIRLSQPCQ